MIKGELGSSDFTVDDEMMSSIAYFIGIGNRLEWISTLVSSSNGLSNSSKVACLPVLSAVPMPSLLALSNLFSFLLARKRLSS